MGVGGVVGGVGRCDYLVVLIAVVVDPVDALDVAVLHLGNGKYNKRKEYAKKPKGKYVCVCMHIYIHIYTHRIYIYI